MTYSLCFDTSGPYCAAALCFEDVVYEQCFEPMARGQAENLMGFLNGLLAARDVKWADMTSIGVGVGPGNFTGVRIAVAAARGAGLALGIPVVSSTSFEAMRDETGPGAHANELVLVQAPREHAYAQMFRYGRPVGAAEVIEPNRPTDRFRGVNLRVTGDFAEEVAGKLGSSEVFVPPPLQDLPRRLAIIHDWKKRNGHVQTDGPTPFYIRPADAAPPRDLPPTIIA